LSSVVVKSIDDALVRRAMDEYAADVLAKRADVEEIVVFGSFANGTWGPGSDLDVLVILARADRPVRDRIPDLLPGPFPVAVDLFPLTRQELEDVSDSPPVAALRESRWRYGRA
jgi:predicted nucleotidyltransferase